ncbi:MAG: c-type cytochrome [Fimbriimonas sp.]
MKQALWLIGLSLMLAGCHTDMWVQPRQDTLLESNFFPDGQSARPLVAGTVARDHLREDQVFFTGVKNGRWVDELPMPITKELLQRGQERYNVFCTPCHGRLGDGKGMIAARGFTLQRPVGNYHTERLRKMPVGHFYDVITNGYGAMYSYASRVEPSDRWAIVTYIRALQLSQNAKLEDADPASLEELRNPKPKAEPSGESHDGAH